MTLFLTGSAFGVIIVLAAIAISGWMQARDIRQLDEATRRSAEEATRRRDE